MIQRVQLDHPKLSTAIIKHIDLSKARQNRRGWSGDISHQRKVRSYEVEKTFYESYANQCDRVGKMDVTDDCDRNLTCRVPKMHAALEKPNSSGWLIVLEDLDDAGFSLRRNCNGNDMRSSLYSCLRWLANFHATFMGFEPNGLWSIGTYWHLATRAEEWQAMEEGRLKQLAFSIDQQLNNAKFQTLVHGDAKLANFCFSESTGEQDEEPDVAAVDFQYVGRGCGMKDVAYLVSSCLDGSQSEAQHNALLDFYFEQLETSLAVKQSGIDFPSVESEWRALYAFAWADFCRFLAGWSPGHWKLNEYNDQITQNVLNQLAGD